jgi:Photosynthesis affected mutant 68
MARPKPRSLAPNAQGNSSASQAKGPAAAAAKASRRNRDSSSGTGTAGKAKGRGNNANRARGSQVIPAAVASRMLRRIAIATGVPSLLGMAVFVLSYLLVSRHIFEIPPVATLLASGSCFLLGVLGLSYGVLSASWEETPGSLLGTEQLGVNISRVRASLRAMRQGGSPPPAA